MRESSKSLFFDLDADFTTLKTKNEIKWSKNHNGTHFQPSNSSTNPSTSQFSSTTSVTSSSVNQLNYIISLLTNNSNVAYANETLFDAYKTLFSLLLKDFPSVSSIIKSKFDNLLKFFFISSKLLTEISSNFERIFSYVSKINDKDFGLHKEFLVLFSEVFIKLISLKENDLHLNFKKHENIDLDNILTKFPKNLHKLARSSENLKSSTLTSLDIQKILKSKYLIFENDQKGKRSLSTQTDQNDLELESLEKYNLKLMQTVFESVRKNLEGVLKRFKKMSHVKQLKEKKEKRVSQTEKLSNQNGIEDSEKLKSLREDQKKNELRRKELLNELERIDLKIKLNLNLIQSLTTNKATKSSKTTNHVSTSQLKSPEPCLESLKLFLDDLSLSTSSSSSSPSSSSSSLSEREIKLLELYDKKLSLLLFCHNSKSSSREEEKEKEVVKEIGDILFIFYLKYGIKLILNNSKNVKLMIWRVYDNVHKLKYNKYFREERFEEILPHNIGNITTKSKRNKDKEKVKVKEVRYGMKDGEVKKKKKERVVEFKIEKKEENVKEKGGAGVWGGWGKKVEKVKVQKMSLLEIQKEEQQKKKKKESQPESNDQKQEKKKPASVEMKPETKEVKAKVEVEKVETNGNKQDENEKNEKNEKMKVKAKVMKSESVMSEATNEREKEKELDDFKISVHLEEDFECRIGYSL